MFKIVRLCAFEKLLSLKLLSEMYQIQESDVAGWRSGGDVGVKCPNTINSICPECGERGTFSVTPESKLTKESALHLQGVWMRGRCPTCSFMARFIQIGEAHHPEYELWIHPSPKLVRKPIEESGESDVFSGRIKKAYVEAIRAYNAKQWIASAVMCGRALEGMTKALLPEEKRKLSFFKQLEDLPNHIGITKTISDLTDGIRKGRNIAAHFDEQMEVDEETASMLIDLLDYIIEYLFVLPQKIEDLDNRLQALKNPASP